MTPTPSKAKVLRVFVSGELPQSHFDSDVFTLIMPFPSTQQYKALSPNGRSHWRARSKYTKLMKDAAILLTRSALPQDHQPWSRAEITYRFFWPNLIGRDEDNYRTAMKPAVDGIVKAGLVVDDNWGVLIQGKEPVSELDRDNPRVEIEIAAAMQAAEGSEG